MPTMTPAIARIAITNTKGIQRGLVTHHHDQLATTPMLANFNTKKTTKIIEPNPIPLLAAF
jgi:hypothetical protein